MQQRLSITIRTCHETGLYIGFVPGLPGIHTQEKNLEEAIEILTELA